MAQTIIVNKKQGPGNQSSLMSIFDGSGTFKLNYRTRYVTLFGCGGGGGGGSGRRSTTTAAAGGGGGASGTPLLEIMVPLDILGVATSGYNISYSVGAGGTRGASVTVDDTDGNAGAAGGDTTIGNLIAKGGGGGSGGTSTAGGGGIEGSYYPLWQIGSVFDGLAGADGNNVAGSASAFSQYWPSGGGGGGGADSGTPRVGGTGGGTYKSDNVTELKAATAQDTAGIAGLIYTVGSTGSIYCGRGGGGGHGDNGAGAGNGGNGGTYGGGGGGGGGSLNGTASGQGGTGGAGFIILIEYF